MNGQTERRKLYTSWHKCRGYYNFCQQHKPCISIQYSDTKNIGNVKFLNLQMPENFAFKFKLPKIQIKRPKHRIFCPKDANGTANSEDPDQTAPLGAV